MRLFTTIAVAALALSTLPAKAADPFLGDSSASQRTSAFYAALRGGISAPDEIGFDGEGIGETSIAGLYDDVNFFVAAAAGTSFGGLRVEGEVAYYGAQMDNDLKDRDTAIAIAAIAGFDITDDVDDLDDFETFGDLNIYTLMANAYYDFDLGRIKPFVGAGVGVGFVDFNLPSGVATFAGLDDTEAAFAYQFTAGLGVDVTESVAAELAYRYQKLQTEVSLGLNDPDLNIESHIGYAGLRAKF